MTITLNTAMRESLRRYIVAQRTWATDPMKAREECRSYAAELAQSIVHELGGEITQEQIYVQRLGGPTVNEQRIDIALAKLEQ